MDRSRKKYLSPTSSATTTPSEALQARATTTPSNTRHGSSGHHPRTTIVVASNIMSDIQHASHDMTPLKRKKSSGSTQPLPSMPRNTEEIEVELPDRQTPRSQVTNTSHSHSSAHRHRRDKGKSADKSSPHPHSHSTHLEAAKEKDNGEKQSYSYSGPLAHADYDRMKKELEAARRSLHDAKKLNKKMYKKLDELKEELVTANLAREEFLKLQDQSSRHEEALTVIEASVQCQICMEQLVKPQALSPCGHVLCLGCLQEWFRKAPQASGDNEEDLQPGSPNYILQRRKSCPCCRATITRRPVPVFVIKAIATALTRMKPGPQRPPTPPCLDDADPWQGIFYPESDLDSDEDEDDEDDEEDDDDPLNLAWDIARSLDEFGYGSPDDERVGEQDDEDEDDEDEDASAFARPRWEPAAYSYRGEADQYLTSDELVMIRRGCTLPMVRRYAMRFTNTDGLIARLPSGYIVYPGYNVHLGPYDPDGQVYMDSLIAEMDHYPRRWEISNEGNFTAMRRLARRDYSDEYSENWLDSEDVFSP